MAEPQNRRLRVFLCHSSNDKPTVRKIYRQLSTENWIDPWLDEEELIPGMDWNMEIEKAVEAADAILVCLSKNSVTKEGYVQRELRIVLDYADYKPEGSFYIFPIRLEACELPRRLRHLQYADYFPPDNHERAYGRLLVGLRSRARALGIATGTTEEPRQADRDPSHDDQYKKTVITLTQDAYDQILTHAQKHFPNMAPGFLLGTDNHVTYVSLLPNTETTNPRNRFSVSPEDYLKAELTADSLGLNLVGLFYSQDGGAGISEYTKQWAQPSFIYLVVGMGTQPPSRRVYKLTVDRTKFIECNLSIG